MDQPALDPAAVARVTEIIEVEVAPNLARFTEQLRGMTAALQPLMDRAPFAQVGPVMGELQAVTETCACHCWENHPQVSGVCEASSDGGSQLNGKPACFECAAASARD